LDGPAEDPRDESIGDLIGRLVDDGRDYAGAELDLLKAVLAYRAVRARRALVALAAGWFLLVTSTTAVVIGTVLSLAERIGPMLAGFAVGIPLAAGGYVLVHYGWTGVKGLARDKGEREAFERGEQPS
jgi:hypothetical protein